MRAMLDCRDEWRKCRLRHAREGRTARRRPASSASGRSEGPRPQAWHAPRRRMHRLRPAERLPEDDTLDAQHSDRSAPHLREGGFHADIKRAAPHLGQGRGGRILGSRSVKPRQIKVSPELMAHYRREADRLRRETWRRAFGWLLAAVTRLARYAVAPFAFGRRMCSSSRGRVSTKL